MYIHRMNVLTTNHKIKRLVHWDFEDVLEKMIKVVAIGEDEMVKQCNGVC